MRWWDAYRFSLHSRMRVIHGNDPGMTLTASGRLVRSARPWIVVLESPLAPQQGINPPVNGAGADSTTEGRA